MSRENESRSLQPRSRVITVCAEAAMQTEQGEVLDGVLAVRFRRGGLRGVEAEV
jgi:hypothetical protein